VAPVGEGRRAVGVGRSLPLKTGLDTLRTDSRTNSRTNSRHACCSSRFSSASMSVSVSVSVSFGVLLCGTSFGVLC
jgi:hypothetical protein